jgi:hypothetical protein
VNDSSRRAPGVRSASIAFDVLLVVNALDLATSAIPRHIDEVSPARSALMLVLQCALLAPLAWRARRLPLVLARRLRALALPRPAAWVLLSFVGIELLHVALRMEIYPFSDVAMFSSLTPSSPAPTFVANVYLQANSGELEIFSFMREGNPWFARHFDWDYKAAWLMRMYKGTPAVDAILAEKLRAAGLTPPTFSRVSFRKRDGAIVRIARLP